MEKNSGDFIIRRSILVDILMDDDGDDNEAAHEISSENSLNLCFCRIAIDINQILMQSHPLSSPDYCMCKRRGISMGEGKNIK
jgi:hypothetical protein